MKRFYCTVCKRVKRVRNYPRLIETPQAPEVTSRVGVCNRHMTATRVATVRKVSAR